ncbi:MAG TPA: FAD-dependent oxidoreductase [Actinophytocola sp.]|nr:FAD-dependent oxidoreductase [Actinophytocola sp.]
MRIAVVGAGVIGLATADALGRRGAEVVCLEADVPMAARSTGSSRIFRLAHADPGLVAYAARARTLWAEWSDRAGTPLVGTEGAVLTGPPARDWSAAMAAVDAAHSLVDDVSTLGLPVASFPGPALLDPAGGVIDVPATAAFLQAVAGPALRPGYVHRLEVAGSGVTLHSSAGTVSADRVVIAAGRGTWQLAAQVGMYVPTALAHHVRFTFPLRDSGARPPCWLDRTQTWRPGFTTYQQCPGPGRWSVGAALPADDQAWERGRAAVTARSRDLVRAYVREVLVGVDDEIVEEVYCDFPPGLGDGIHVTSAGPVTALWGDNLFKHAPAIGTSLATALVEDAVPDIPPS